jgi:pyruvyltransferase
MTSRKVPIKLFWSGGRSGSVNYGDDLTSVLIPRLFGYQVSYAGPSTADLCGADSILHRVSRRIAFRWATRMGKPIFIWGSGVIKDKPVQPMRLMLFGAIRGPVSQKMTSLSSFVPHGDPGLLAPMLVPHAQAKDISFGIIPHIRDQGHPDVKRLLEGFPNSKVIDLSARDVVETTKVIQRCEYVLSSSLHGLIVADAFRIPNIRLSLSNRIVGGNIKYDDYSQSVGRGLSFPSFQASELLESNLMEHFSVAANEIIEKRQVELLRVLSEWLATRQLVRAYH